VKYGKQALTKKLNPENLIDAENQFLLNRLNKKFLLRSIYLCCSCYLLFQNPTYDKNDLQCLYNDRGPKIASHYKSVKNLSRSDLSLLIKKNSIQRQKRYAKMIMAYGGTKILDYGGSLGTNLMNPSLSSLQRYVYDFGRDSKPGEGVNSLKNIDDIHRFDFILHTHVLEHETEPLSSLKKLRRILAPEGFLYLEVPFEYAERILTRKPGAIWHVNYFNRNSIIKIANRTGWICEFLKISYLPYNHFFMNCIVALMKPYSDGLNDNGPANNVQMLYDMGRSLLTRLISESCRKSKG
jgi:SAM-dependent methyltransferase